MTREEAKKYLPIMQAFAEGKTIQYLDDRGFWNDIKTCVSFDYNISCYRIKPEPKYRPFKTQEECWKEMHKHTNFGWIKDIKSGEFLQIVCITDEGVYGIKHSVCSHLFKSLVQEFNFTDGTPFGIKEE